MSNFGPVTEDIKLVIIQANPGDVHSAPADLDVIPYDVGTLPFQLVGLIPYELRVAIIQDGWLETPKIFIPGYAAMLDGQPTPVSRSPDGLVMIPITAGKHHLVLRYAATSALRISFWLNAGSLAVLGCLLLRQCVRKPAPGLLPDRALERMGIGATIAGVLCLGGLGLHEWHRMEKKPLLPTGLFALEVQFPVGRHEVYEPLLSIADTAGHTTTIVAFYQDDHTVRIGCRKDGVLRLMTDTLRTSYFLSQEIEILFGPLLLDQDRGRFNGLSDDDWNTLRHSVRVTFNHHDVLQLAVNHPGATAFKFAVGKDPFDPGHAAEPFRGTITTVRGVPEP